MKKRLQSLHLAVGAADPFKLLNRRTICELVHVVWKRSFTQKPVAHIGRYVIGQKRYQACETYIQWNNFWCPCCGYRLRTKPRNSRNKTNFRVQYAKQDPSVY
jgi:hypothetical protein